ncbi:MAG TPA: cytochrome c5 family protein [Gammaproteobacteria bacterium]|nr:cytochrome c5 family protein [Gammaproteobacteria bacterium]HQZ87496.1 cytochrome c5 family protein [Gammaproteobacteria bacterium]
MRRLALPLIITAFGTFFVARVFADLSGSLDEKAIIQRIHPEGEVTIEAGSAMVVETPKVILDVGQQHYEQVCHICHGTGLAGAPKFGDKADWAPRIADGMATMVKRAIEGYKAMPPKGTCTNCSDDDIKKTVEYMVSHSQ